MKNVELLKGYTQVCVWEGVLVESTDEGVVSYMNIF